MNEAPTEKYILHSIKRLKQRHKTIIGSTEYYEACDSISAETKEKYLLIRRFKDGRFEECFVSIYGVWFPVVFDRKRHIIITVLAPEVATLYLRKLEKHKIKLKSIKNKVQEFQKILPKYDFGHQPIKRPAFVY